MLRTRRPASRDNDMSDKKRNDTEVETLRTTPDWNKELLEQLRSDIESFAPLPEVQVPQSKIPIIGPVGAGKSSFFNTIASVFRGHVTGQAASGSSEHSITSQYRMYRVRNFLTENPLNFRLCDTRGIEESLGLDAKDVAYLIDGNVPNGHQFNPSVPISSEIHGFKKNPSLKDQIHCVCIVIDASSVDVLPEKILEKIRSIQAVINLKNVPQRILMTKVDKICPTVEADTSYVFESKAVLEQVNKISQLLGVPRSHVLPVKNYEREIEVNDSINILALMALRQMLRATEDYMFNFTDEIEQNVAFEMKEKNIKRTLGISDVVNRFHIFVLACMCACVYFLFQLQSK